MSSLKSLDYSIHLESGFFDPLVDEWPKSRLDDLNDYCATGMAIVQLHHHTGDALSDFVDTYDVQLLDNLGSSNWLVRLSHPDDMFKIQADESVRWAGSMMPGGEFLSVDSSTKYISVIPARI